MNSAVYPFGDATFELNILANGRLGQLPEHPQLLHEPELKDPVKDPLVFEPVKGDVDKKPLRVLLECERNAPRTLINVFEALAREVLFGELRVTERAPSGPYLFFPGIFPF